MFSVSRKIERYLPPDALQGFSLLKSVPNIANYDYLHNADHGNRAVVNHLSACSTIDAIGLDSTAA